ncbi:apoptosis regulator Bcl-2-like [Carassius carassius]|uniref:apoptosis regulator Bcl-2-like n=1 Tax=Carassius carassius TaxID=217509 RepID=UPI0022775BEE|nr:apoptosis regulator Bcl-2-like isoform X1 [Carassius gibelio]XP_059358411.1 apoptosis regulator Bcl-2-like [Carassius carassius]
MAQENVFDNRSIVVKYIHHKLWKKGYVWEVNGHDDGVSNGLMMERQEDRGSRHDPCSALHTVLRDAGDELERLYQSDFAEMSKQLHITSITAQQRFTAVIDELFRDGVNWGRIIAFFEFGGTVCVECVNKEMTAHVDNIAGWMTEYLNGPLHAWIQENGGWEAFVELYGRQRDSVFRSSWSSIVTVFGLAALGAVGLTIGAYLAQK